MVRRLVDYVAVVALHNPEVNVHNSEDDLSSKGSGEGLTGGVTQRFPEHDWPDMRFPDRIEWFCQPGGWHLYDHFHAPTFYTAVLTGEEGAQTYLSCLTFYEPCEPREDAAEVDDEFTGMLLFRTGSKRGSLAASYQDLPRKQYAPKCLVFLSRVPLFKMFKDCLRSIYKKFIEKDAEVLEKIIATLLATEVPLGIFEEPITVELDGLELELEENQLTTTPVTGTSVLTLVSTIGIAHTLQLLSALLTDQKVLFVSSNYSTLLSSTKAATDLIYPLTLRHYTYIPILPHYYQTIEVLHSPTPYLIGVHCTADLDEIYMDELVRVDLDGGRVCVPEKLQLPEIPAGFKAYLTHCLKLIIHPSYLLSDLAFAPPPRTISDPHLQDKEIRAVFMQFFAWLLANYRCCLIVVRTHPKSVVKFNKKRFLAIRSFQEEPFIHQMFETITFNTFIDEYGPPYRTTTIFDELVCAINEQPPKPGSNQDQFLPLDITVLAAKLLEQERCMSYTADELPENENDKLFPMLDELRIEEILAELGVTHTEPDAEPCHVEQDIVLDRPLPQEVLPRGNQIAVRKGMDAVHNCLKSMFLEQLFAARRLLPSACKALAGHPQIRNKFVQELKDVEDCKGSLSIQQFDILAVLINSALEHDKGVDAGDFAINIMPLTAKFCRQLQFGTVQFIYSCVQHHPVWHDISFWERAFYCIVQGHILDVFETMEQEGDLKLTYDQHDLHNGFGDDVSMQQISQRALYHSAARMSVWRGLSTELQQEIIQREETTIVGQCQHFSNIIMWLMVPLNINYDEEQGYSANNINELEYMNVFDHLSYNDPNSPTIKEPSRLDKHDIVKFIGRFIETVEANCDLEDSHIAPLKNKIPDMLDMHCDQLDEVCREAARLPPVMKTTFLRAKLDLPSLVPLERFVAEPLHVYMLPDGRDNGQNINHGKNNEFEMEAEFLPSQPALLPAEGALFLTNYRLIFRGYPHMSDDENTVIYRSLPLGAISNISRDPLKSPSNLEEDEEVIEMEMQIHSLTCQLFRIGFFNEHADDTITQYQRKLVSLRKVNKIVHTFAFVRPEESFVIPKTASHHTKSGQMSRKNTLAVQQSNKLALNQNDAIVKSPSLANKLKKEDGALCSSPSVSSLASIGDDQSENISLVSGLTASSFFPSGSFRLKRTKKRQILKYLPDFGYCEDFARMTFGGFNDIGKSSNRPWRLTAENKNYDLCRSYPAIMVVPSLTTEIDLHGVARQFHRNRFPVITWKHPLHETAVLLRSAGVVKRGAMEKLVTVKHRMADRLLQNSNGTKRETALPEQGFRSVDTVSYINGLVHCIKKIIDHKLTFARNKAKNQNLPNKARKFFVKRFETLGFSSNDKLNQIHGRSLNFTGSQLGLSYIPEGDAVSQATLAEPEEEKRTSLFIIGNNHDLKVARLEAYNEVEMIGMDHPDFREVASSYDMLFSACCPDSSKADSSTFWKEVESSGWLGQIQGVLELSLAIVELMNKWGVSVLIALEDGSNITSQISSTVQLLTDPHYRTIKGFTALIEKDWLSFGHRFSLHGRHTEGKEDDFAPIFLQFLDIVYQIHRQFPWCFEFNEFYLETMAYHHCSMRFRTFVCDSEKKRRQEVGMFQPEDDSRNSTPEMRRKNSVNNANGGSGSVHTGDDTHSYWNYIDDLKKGAPIFYNYLYTDAKEPVHILRPNPHIAALELWRFYTRDDTTQGPAYEPDLAIVKTSEGKKVPATPKDLMKEGIGSLLIDLAELKLKQTGLEESSESPWLYMLYNYHIDTKSRYKPSSSFNSVSCHTQLRLHQLGTNISMLTNGKIRDTGHRFQKYVYDPFNESDKTHCYICEYLQPNALPVRKGLKCFYCGYTIHPMCQLFVTRKCKKKEQEELEELINIQHRPKHSVKHDKEARKSKIILQPPDTTTPPVETKITDPEDLAAANGTPQALPSPRRVRDGDSTRFEGTLYKKGGLLKQWRPWKFELNGKLRELRYYETASDAHVHYIRKTIDLSGKIKVTPTPIYGVIAREGQQGYPFEIKTERRILVLVADNKELRDIWMRAIRNVGKSG